MSRPGRQARDYETRPDPVPSRRPKLDLADENAPRKSSPARKLQHAVEDGWDDHAAPPSRRWAPRATLLFSGAVALLLWIAIISAAVMALRFFNL